MPLFSGPRPDLRARESTERTVLVGGSPHGLRAVRRRRLDTILARLRDASLDRRLARGEAPENNRFLAVRAAMVTTPRARESLARCWEELAVRARQAATAPYSRVPIARAQVDAAADEIDRVADALRSPRPVSAAGVAAASLLLTSPDSPVYGVLRGGDLPAAIARAVAVLSEAKLSDTCGDGERA